MSGASGAVGAGTAASEAVWAGRRRRLGGIANGLHS